MYYRVKKIGMGGAYSYGPTIYHLVEDSPTTTAKNQVILSPEHCKTEAQLFVMGMWQKSLHVKIEKVGSAEIIRRDWMIYTDTYTIPLDLTGFDAGTYFWIFFDEDGNKITEQKLFIQ